MRLKIDRYLQNFVKKSMADGLLRLQAGYHYPGADPASGRSTHAAFKLSKICLWKWKGQAYFKKEKFIAK